MIVKVATGAISSGRHHPGKWMVTKSIDAGGDRTLALVRPGVGARSELPDVLWCATANRSAPVLCNYAKHIKALCTVKCAHKSVEGVIVKTPIWMSVCVQTSPTRSSVFRMGRCCMKRRWSFLGIRTRMGPPQPCPPCTWEPTSVGPAHPSSGTHFAADTTTTGRQTHAN